MLTLVLPCNRFAYSPITVDRMKPHHQRCQSRMPLELFTWSVSCSSHMRPRGIDRASGKRLRAPMGCDGKSKDAATAVISSVFRTASIPENDVLCRCPAASKDQRRRRVIRTARKQRLKYCCGFIHREQWTIYQTGGGAKISAAAAAADSSKNKKEDPMHSHTQLC